MTEDQNLVVAIDNLLCATLKDCPENVKYGDLYQAILKARAISYQMLPGWRRRELEEGKKQ